MFLALSVPVVNPLQLISVGFAVGCHRRDRCDGRCGRGGRGWRRHKSDRRTRHQTTISEQLIRIIDVEHPLFGQRLEVSGRGASRRNGWIGVVLPDGRHRWIPQEATDLNDPACDARANRDLPQVSVRTLRPLAEYVRARLSAAREGIDGTSGHAADPAVRAGVAGSRADLGAEIVADDDTDNTTTAGKAGGTATPVGAGRSR
jgi:hypothetical protein